MKWRTDGTIVVAALVLGHVGFFHLAAYRCENGLPEVVPGGLKALVVSDVHLLGKRRRSLVERLWIDTQIASSLQAAVRVHRPDVILVLGDQLDEGGYPTSDQDYEEYISRFRRAFASAIGVETIYLIGNHDSAFGRFLTPSAITRHERAFGPSNYATTIKGHRIVLLNTMALDQDVADVEVQAEAASFLQALAKDIATESSREERLILLSHFPLHRENDLGCGADRLNEQGHVTYEHPSFQYETHHHVLSEALSRDLLARVQPDVVLSGHTHAWCEFRHAGAAEFTIPAFSWGQRPDPSYALLVSSPGHAPRAFRCALPQEPFVFALYGAALSVLVLRLLWRCAVMSRRHRRLQHHPKKLK